MTIHAYYFHFSSLDEGGQNFKTCVEQITFSEIVFHFLK